MSHCQEGLFGGGICSSVGIKSFAKSILSVNFIAPSRSASLSADSPMSKDIAKTVGPFIKEFNSPSAVLYRTDYAEAPAWYIKSICLYVWVCPHWGQSLDLPSAGSMGLGAKKKFSNVSSTGACVNVELQFGHRNAQLAMGTPSPCTLALATQ